MTGTPEVPRHPGSPEELGSARRRSIRNGIGRLVVLSLLLWRVILESGPWTAAAIGLLYLAFELYERQARRAAEVLLARGYELERATSVYTAEARGGPH